VVLSAEVLTLVGRRRAGLLSLVVAVAGGRLSLVGLAVGYVSSRSIVEGGR
jgi:hypothetical protein